MIENYLESHTMNSEPEIYKILTAPGVSTDDIPIEVHHSDIVALARWHEAQLTEAYNQGAKDMAEGLKKTLYHIVHPSLTATHAKVHEAIDTLLAQVTKEEEPTLGTVHLDQPLPEQTEKQREVLDRIKREKPRRIEPLSYAELFTSKGNPEFTQNFGALANKVDELVRDRNERLGV